MLKSFIPKNPDFGDLSILVDRAKEDILKEIKKMPNVYKIEDKGRFINIFFNPLEILKKEKPLKKENKKIMIEFSQPNPNKEMHIGHLRGSIVGDFLARLLQEKYQVIRANLFNDKGIHMAKTILGLQLIKAKEINKDTIEKAYTYFAKNESKELEEKAKEILRKIEEKDPATIKILKELRDTAIKAFKEIYELLDIKFDIVYYESELYEKGKEIVLKKYKEGIVKKNEKGYYIDLSKYNLPNKILLRADNTAIYATADIAIAMEKFKNYDLDLSIILTDKSQDLYFKQLFAVFKELSFNFYDKNLHLSYGTVKLPSGKMSSRKGNVIKAKDLYNEIYREIYKKTKEKRTDLSKDKINEICKALSIAALKFSILKYEAKKDIVFDIEKSTSLTKESGPYLLYTYVRINSIIKKSKSKRKFPEALDKNNFEIARLLSKHNAILEDSLKHYTSHFLAQYCLKLCDALNSYLSKERILNSKNEEDKTALLRIALKKLEKSFELFGFKIIDEM